NTFCDGAKTAHQTAEGGPRAIKETHPVKIDVDCNHQVSPQFTGVSDRKIGEEATVEQKPALAIADRGIQRRDAATGPNRKRQIPGVAKYDRLTFLQISYHHGQRNF